VSSELHALANAAGIEIVWRDATGKTQRVSDDSLRAVLHTLGFPAGSGAQIRESLVELQNESTSVSGSLLTATLNRPIPLAGQPGNFRITLESGSVLKGIARPYQDGIRLPSIKEPGYHRLEIGDTVATIAVSPARACTLEDVGGGAMLWGLAVQIYALRRKRGGDIGDFAALAEFTRCAAAHGADAVAISPVHAQFSADVTRYGPYSASSRAALNVLFTALDAPDTDSGDLINWPDVAKKRLQILRENFDNLPNLATFAGFRQQAGPELERHAIFEALFAQLSHNNPAARDFRNWPQPYQDPNSAAVAHFAKEHKHDIDFHIWLQYRADCDLAHAQKVARESGMKIGLITDLAVGTAPNGSHSWTRQDEILRGLEVGAPPDLFNRAGQNWGITTFSPRGLRNNGFAAFIDMLRHALRHAGGVRIDHVMGLARLWVIPSGASCAQGAYLRMPMDDLIRLAVLESHRHRAVILGEDLGTLPPGFRRKLGAAGIAGLRVLWFERQGRNFKPPQKWTKTATAMTTTHDLPTVAGWWQETDISWRQKLGIANDPPKTRDKDRTELWSAFQKSGATTAPIPPAHSGTTAADTACAHLGHAACALVLLPIEDALGLTEQPNLPGTVDEHPNWRRRLPDDADTLFARPDVVSRLAALNRARKS
jgi:4-alpha-glucanotransferase